MCNSRALSVCSFMWAERAWVHSWEIALCPPAALQGLGEVPLQLTMLPSWWWCHCQKCEGLPMWQIALGSSVETLGHGAGPLSS